MPQARFSNKQGLEEIAEAIRRRSQQGYILITHDPATDDWVIDLDERMDGLLVAQLLDTFKQAMLRSLAAQMERPLPAPGAAPPVDPPVLMQEPPACTG